MDTCCTRRSISAKDLEKTAKLLSAIQETNRLRILCLLKKGELCVCSINGSLGLSQHLVSHHLAKLHGAGLVSMRREGRRVYYALVGKRVEELVRTISKTLTP